jgi:quinol monooxygenase YgiN
MMAEHRSAECRKRVKPMFENIGWIVEAKIKDGKRAEFEAVVEEIVAQTRKEGGTLNYQYYVSDDGDVLVYERFGNVESAHIHVTNWDNFAERWTAAAPATRMVHLGDLPEDLRERHAALAPKLLKPFNGFSR